jgi:hypothetical protein
MPKKTKTTPAAKAPAFKKPDWLLETSAMLYSLEACSTDHNGESAQLIELTMD